MIQIRWALQHRGYIDKERILQSRISRQVIGPDSIIRWEWAEWEDVPEVDVTNTPKEKT